MSIKPTSKVRPNILLDSGAFSVWRRGDSIDIQEYIDFCLEYSEWIWHPVALDEIPGHPGHPRTPAQVEKAAKNSFKNTNKMRKAGVDAIPVFHQGEQFRWLEKMVEEGYDYIGLAPNKSLSTSFKLPWLDDCFKLLAGDGGFPPVKLHAFGETSTRILFGYPWYSVDSTSWIMIGAMGKILVPPLTLDGKYDFTVPPFVVPVSEGLDGKSSGSAMVQGRDFRTMGDRNKQYVLDYAKYLKVTMEELAKDDKARKRACIKYFQDVAKAYKNKPFKPKRAGFFSVASTKRCFGVSKWRFEKGLRFAFVSGVSRQNLWMVDKERAQHVLISYADIARNRTFSLPDFVDGKMDLDRRRKKKVFRETL